MKGFLRWFASHATAANLLMLLFLFLGVLGVPQLLRETFPDFKPTKVRIEVPYPGASAEDVEEAICQRIEDALEAVTGKEEVVSEARENVGIVIVEMQDGWDFVTFLSEVKTEVDAIDDFPDDTEEPVVREEGKTDMVASVAVTGPMSVPDLKAYCEALKRRMMRLPDVAEVEILGFSDRQIRIEVQLQTLLELGLSAESLARTVGMQSVDMPGGLVETGAEDILLRFTDLRRSVAQYEDLVVVADAGGAEIRLGEIASISDRFELDEDKIAFDGQRAGLLQISKTDNQDALEVLAAVLAFVEEERAVGPPSVSLEVTRNVTKIVDDRLTMLTENSVQGLILVFITLWLFFNIRFSFWVAMGLPVSFAVALFSMHLIGFSLNMLSMVGLLLALGLIMDDAIVLAENVATHLAKGKKALDAVVDGVSEISVGVISSFATTLGVFGCLAMFVAGDIGKVLWVMPVVLILTLAVSLIEAFLILPNHLAHALQGHEQDPPGRFRERFNQKLDWFRERMVGGLVDRCVRHRYLFAGGMLALLILTISTLAGGILKTRAFPDVEGDVLEARVLLPQGTPLHRTEQVVAQLVTALQGVNAKFASRQPAGKDLIQHHIVQYSQNVNAKERGAHLATVTADLLASEERDATMDEIIHAWREATGAVPDVLSLTFKEPAIGPAGEPIEIRLVGDDLDALRAAAGDIMLALAEYTGVFDLMSDLRPGKRELRLTMREGANSLGLTAGEVARQIRTAFHGATADEVQVGMESYEIDIRLAPENRDSLGDLDTFRIRDGQGNQIPLEAVAAIQEGRGWSRISRVDGQRTVTIIGDVDGRVANANQIVGHLRATALPAVLEKYTGVRADFEGQEAAGRETGQSMLLALVTGLFLVYLLLSLQFKSYLEPVVVMVSIPMTLVGVVSGHLLLGYELSMVSIMGFISLAGIVVNNAILLVEFIRIRMAEGLHPIEAARAASRQRFRAVLITSLTTIAGMFPLMLEQSTQAQVLQPLVVSIVFGLTASTFLVLFMVPALYGILADLGLLRKEAGH